MNRKLAVAVTASLALALTLPSSVEAQVESPEMEALERYVGHWRAEDTQAQDGRTFHFEYELDWYDPGKTMVEMLITQVFEDGEVRVLWKGFKGLHPESREVYYYGFSPSGRASRGHVELDGDNLVTVYEGWSPDGAVVEIRDIFTPVRDDAFSGRTLLRAAPEEEWRQISADEWTRMDEPQPAR